MAVELNKSLNWDYYVLSTDTKPTNCTTGCLLWELDTKTGYVFSAENENPSTENGWWAI